MSVQLVDTVNQEAVPLEVVRGPFTTVIAAFDSTGVADGAMFNFAGRDTVGDGGGGPFRYSSSSTQPADGGIVFAPVGGGRLFREGWTVLGFKGPLKLEWFGAKATPGIDNRSAVQSAITSACANKTSIQVAGLYEISGTLNFPSNSSGCLIEGLNKKSGFRFTGTGSLLSAVSTNSLQLRNLALIGPGSAVSATAISCQTSDTSVGVYYCSFTDLTIEGFRYGMSVAGLCEAMYSNIKIGLAKSGLFTGSDADACPDVGISIGSTVLANQFFGLTIFAKKRCIEQTTQQQIPEGLYFYGCTFDLSFNTGASSNEQAVYLESGQDIVFVSCWFTNSQKYGSTSGPYSDSLLKIAYNPGSISAPLVSVKFSACTFVGNSLSLQFGSSPSATREVSFGASCVFRLWANLGQFVIGGSLNGFSLVGNVFQFYGDSASGGAKYDLPQAPLNFTNIQNYKISDNSFSGVLPINAAPSYIIVGNTLNGTISGNQFPDQASLSSGNDVQCLGTNVNVTVLGSQQVQGRQFVTTLTNSTYSGDGTVVASIDTGLTKPRMAIVEVNFGSVNISGTGYLALNQGSVADKSMLVPSTGGNLNILFTRVMLVTGVVRLSISGSTAFTPASSTSAEFKITLI